MRLCLGCGEGRPKSQLIRIVKTKEGDISVDITGKKSGRGAYICNNADCLNKLEKNKKLSRSFSMEIPSEIFVKLREELADATD
ncbi:MAG: YlxR family protein [Clostridia bacterium]|nr:YlxR family protein [Clostridia bacterium]